MRLYSASALALLLTSATALAQPAEPVPPVEPAPPEEAAPADAAVEATAAAEPAAVDGGAISAKYDKGFTLETADGQFEMKTGIRGQLRIESRRPEGGEFSSAFMVPRLRLQIEGHAFGPANLYKVEFDMANKGFSLLKDYFYEHAFSDSLRLRLGQWKRPFNRQELISDFGSEFLERSITNEFAGGGRDLGVAVHNNYEKSPEGIEWAVGVFNAASEKPKQSVAVECTDPADITTCTITPGTPSNVPADFGPMLVARVGFNRGGIKGYSDGDLEGGPLRFAVGASYKVNLADLAEDAQQHAAEVDALVKVQGLSVLAAGFLVKNPGVDAEFGALLQPGYFLVPKTYQVAGRFGLVTAGDEQLIEGLGVFNWHFHGHNYKAQLDGGVIHSTADSSNNLQIRSQLQFVF